MENLSTSLPRRSATTALSNGEDGEKLRRLAARFQARMTIRITYGKLFDIFQAGLTDEMVHQIIRSYERNTDPKGNLSVHTVRTG